MKSLALILVVAVNLQSNAQSDLSWIGDNLTEVWYAKGQWYFQDYGETTPLYRDENGYYRPEELSGHHIPVNFITLDIHRDTLYLVRGRSMLLFIKPTNAKYSNFRFHAFEFAEVDQFGIPLITYYLNKHSLYRVSNQRNETITERYIPEDTLQLFLELCQQIDIRGMDNAHGTPNNCDNLEYRFIFWDTMGRKHQYRSIYLRKQLVPIMEFIVALNE